MGFEAFWDFGRFTHRRLYLCLQWTGYSVIPSGYRSRRDEDNCSRIKIKCLFCNPNWPIYCCVFYKRVIDQNYTQTVIPAKVEDAVGAGIHLRSSIRHLKSAIRNPKFLWIPHLRYAPCGMTTIEKEWIFYFYSKSVSLNTLFKTDRFVVAFFISV